MQSNEKPPPGSSTAVVDRAVSDLYGSNAEHEPGERKMSDVRDPALRVVYMPKDTNRYGTIFGGVILSTIDLAAAVEARKTSGCHKYVTVAMDKVDFKKPVYIEDVVSFYTETVRVGRTSVTTECVVEATRFESQETVRVTEAEVVFVAVDKERKPIPIKKEKSL